jgi:DNA-directed RNA polymerase specialized sigma24 family protein
MVFVNGIPEKPGAMKYIINNEKSIKSEKERANAERIIAKQVDRLERITRTYPKPVTLDLYFNAVNRDRIMVSAVVNLKGDIIYLKEKGDDLDALLYSLFDRMKLTISKRIHKERKDYLYKRKNQQYEAFMENLMELQELKKEKERELFSHLLQIILNDVAKYVRRRIKSAEMTTAVKRGKFKVQELLDELYALIYDRIEQVPGDEKKTRAWLYHQADEILQEEFREIEFEEDNFEQLDRLVDAEYRSMEETITMDAENEVVLMEDLDDYEQIAERYAAEGLNYEEDENSLLDEITLRLNLEEIHSFIEKELAKYPLFKRTIMDLYLINQMSVEEISEIKRISATEVEAVIREVNAELKRKLAFLE